MSTRLIQCLYNDLKRCARHVEPFSQTSPSALLFFGGWGGGCRRKVLGPLPSGPSYLFVLLVDVAGLQLTGDGILFIMSSAQVMYAYVMRPETLPV
jgi:hypothetical protein